MRTKQNKAGRFIPHDFRSYNTMIVNENRLAVSRPVSVCSLLRGWQWEPRTSVKEVRFIEALAPRRLAPLAYIEGRRGEGFNREERKGPGCE